MSERQSRQVAKPRPFNSSLECGLRLLFVLDAARSVEADLQRLVIYDYLLLHSGDVHGGPPSLHPAVPFRSGELLVKRELVRSGLNYMISRELLTKSFGPSGISYRATELTTAFILLMRSRYADLIRRRATWLIGHFGSMSDPDLASFISENIGRWGAEFDHLAALDDLEL